LHLYKIKIQNRILVGKPEGKRPLGRSRRRWVDNIKMDHRETGWDCKDWIDLAQDRDQWRALVNTVMNLRVPYKSWEVPECSFSGRAQLRKYVSKYKIQIQNASHAAKCRHFRL
jgi:hypothetical protein